MRYTLLVTLLAAGCASTVGSFTTAPPRVDVHALAEKYPHAVAVLLRREEGVSIDFRPGYPSRALRHDIIAILAEGGDRWAEVTIPLGNARLESLRARTIASDGRVEVVAPEEVHTATARTGGRIDGVEVSAKVFRVPGARVGSVVEYSYEVATDHSPYYLRSPMSATIPVEHYHLEVEIHGPVDLAVRLYNTQAKTDKQKADDVQRLVIDQDDIPANTKEPFAPPASVTEPWWAVTVTKALLRRQIFGVYDTWSHTMSGLSKGLFDDKGRDYLPTKLKPMLSLAGCEDNPRCAAERALMMVTSKTSLTSFVSDPFAVRPVKDVLASGTANNMEKALFLRAALEAAGVKANLAALARSLDVDFDPGFPSPGRIDHLIVLVERQPGFDASLFIDPSCESCAIGEIPEWSKDRQVLVFGKPSAPTTYAQTETPVTITRVDGKDPEMSVHKQSIEAELDMEGALRGRITDEWQGVQALDFHIASRSWSAEQWQRELADDLHGRTKTAQPGVVTPMTWDKRDAHGAVTVEYTAPGFATAEGGRLVVPLSFLRMSSDHELPDEPRRHDVMVRSAVREEESMTFHLPAGWVARDLPAPQLWHSDAADGLLQVTSAPGRVTIRRVLQTKVGHWGPAEFDDLAGVLRKLAAVRAAAFTIAPGS